MIGLASPAINDCSCCNSYIRVCCCWPCRTRINREWEQKEAGSLKKQVLF